MRFTLRSSFILLLLSCPMLAHAEEPDALRSSTITAVRQWLLESGPRPTSAQRKTLADLLKQSPNDPELLYFHVMAHEYAPARPRLDLSEMDDTAALKALQTSADAKFAPAMAEFGKRIFTGVGTKPDQAAGLKLIQAAADTDDPAGLMVLGYLRLVGAGELVKPDPGQAEPLLRRAVEKGNLRATAELALVLYRTGRAEEALKLASEQAKKGDPRSMWFLAMAYRTAPNPNREMALQIMVRAAQSGEPEILADLARYYQEGVGCTPNPTEAFRIATMAMQRGSAEGAYFVALALERGAGIVADTKQSTDILTKLSKRGHRDAQLLLGRRYVEGLFVPRDLKRASELLKAAADAGSLEARQYVEWIEKSDTLKSQN